ncbi:MAG: hypothetical protein EXR62_13875 [Chloroflexi bacterium]|nr:hypothetical protein [Chloroflexota bacterium]
MRYTVREITWGSAARLGCGVGWLVALPPALCLAALAVQILLGANRALENVQPLTISLLGQNLARIDLLENLRLRDTAQTVAGLIANTTTTFILLVLLLVVTGGLLLTIIALLFAAGYNLLGLAGWGLTIELEEAHPPKHSPHSP